MVTSNSARSTGLFFRFFHNIFRLTTILVIVAIPAVLSAAVTIDAALDQTQFSIDQSTQLAITVSTDRQAVDLAIPEVEGLRIFKSGISRTFSQAGSTVVTSVTYSFTVRGIRSGTYTIPPIPVRIDSVIYHTHPLVCTITEPQASSNELGYSPAPPSPPAFLRLIPAQPQAVLNDVVTATIEVRVKSGIKIRFTSSPRLNNPEVFFGHISDTPRRYQEIINRTPYTVLSWECILIGRQTGQHHLQAHIDAVVSFPAQARHEPPPFSSQNDTGSLGLYQRQRLSLRAAPVTFTVYSLPMNGAPSDFSGSVGTFTLDATAAPHHIETGRPLTVTMIVSGSGNFTTVRAPLLHIPDTVRSYPPTQTFFPEGSPFHGRMIFEQVIVITDPATRQIGPVSFSFFDPALQQYRTEQTEPITVRVYEPVRPADIHEEIIRDDHLSPAEKSPPRSLPEPNKTAPEEQDSVALHPFWLIVLSIGTALAVAGSVCIYFLHRRGFGTSIKHAAARQRRITQMIIARASRQPEGTLEEVRRSVSDFLALVWQVNARSLSTNDIGLRFGEASPLYLLFKVADEATFGLSPLNKRAFQDLYSAVSASLAAIELTR